MPYQHNPVPEDIEDLRRYLDQELRNIGDTIENIEFWLNQCVVSAYGGGSQESDVAFDIPAVTYAVLPMDTALPNQRGVSVNLTNNSITPNFGGTWRISMDFNIGGHNSVNSGRVVYLRVWNLTDGLAVSSEAAIGIGRNQEDTAYSTTLLVDLSDDVIGKEIQLQVGGGDAVTGGDLIGSSFHINRVEELGALLG